jgi:hypothetical protein
VSQHPGADIAIGYFGSLVRGQKIDATHHRLVHAAQPFLWTVDCLSRSSSRTWPATSAPRRQHEHPPPPRRAPQAVQQAALRPQRPRVQASAQEQDRRARGRQRQGRPDQRRGVEGRPAQPVGAAATQQACVPARAAPRCAFRRAAGGGRCRAVGAGRLEGDHPVAGAGREHAWQGPIRVGPRHPDGRVRGRPPRDRGLPDVRERI